MGTALLEHVAQDQPRLRLDVNEQNPVALALYTARVSSRSDDRRWMDRDVPSRFCTWRAMPGDPIGDGSYDTPITVEDRRPGSPDRSDRVFARRSDQPSPYN